MNVNNNDERKRVSNCNDEEIDTRNAYRAILEEEKRLEKMFGIASVTSANSEVQIEWIQSITGENLLFNRQRITKG